MVMSEPEIHAVEMVRRIREEHYARLKGLTSSEKIAFFRKKASALHAELGKHEVVLEYSKRLRVGKE
jgi:hypothetical protein